MNAAEACLQLVEKVPESLVQSVIAQLRSGNVPAVPSPTYQLRVAEFLQAAGGVRTELAGMLEVACRARRSRPTAELVWTGPETSVVPIRQTEQVIYELIESAESRITIMSFAVFKIPRLIQALESAIARSVDMRIVLGEPAGNDWMAQQQSLHLGPLIASQPFVCRWPTDRRRRDHDGRCGLMHVKAVAIDGRAAFISSANFTEAAFELNMELGILLRGGTAAGEIERLVDALLQTGDLAYVKVVSNG